MAAFLPIFQSKRLPLLAEAKVLVHDLGATGGPERQHYARVDYIPPSTGTKNLAIGPS
jgi:hypothetical protein